MTTLLDQVLIAVIVIGTLAYWGVRISRRKREDPWPLMWKIHAVGISATILYVLVGAVLILTGSV